MSYESHLAYVCLHHLSLKPYPQFSFEFEIGATAAPGGALSGNRPGEVYRRLASAPQQHLPSPGPSTGPCHPLSGHGARLARPSRHHPGRCRRRTHLRTGGGHGPSRTPPQGTGRATWAPFCVRLGQAAPRSTTRRQLGQAAQAEAGSADRGGQRPHTRRRGRRAEGRECPDAAAPVPPPRLPRARGGGRASARPPLPRPPRGQPPGRAPEGGPGCSARERTCPRRRRAGVSGWRSRGAASRGRLEPLLGRDPARGSTGQRAT